MCSLSRNTNILERPGIEGWLGSFYQRLLPPFKGVSADFVVTLVHIVRAVPEKKLCGGGEFFQPIDKLPLPLEKLLILPLPEFFPVPPIVFFSGTALRV